MTPSRIAVAMLTATLIGLSALGAAAARAEEPLHVRETDEHVIKLMPGPCTDSRTVLLVARGSRVPFERWRHMETLWNADGKWEPWGGCWLEVTAEEAGAPGDVILMLWADGSNDSILKRRFERRRGTGT
jgi:hypothetical protein